MRHLLAALLLLAACAPTRPVTIEGRTVPYEEAAQQDFRRGQALYDQGNYAAAAAALGGFLSRYPESKLAEEALFRRGQALVRAGQLEQAEAALQELLEKHPTSPFKSAAAAELGIVLPLSGDLKGFADQALNGIALTLDLQNRGSLLVEIKDSKGEPDAAADAVAELAQAGAIAILGPLGLAEGPAAAARAQQLGIPLVSLSRAEGLTALGDYVFRDMPTSSAQARAVAEYAQRKLNVKGFGILHPDSPYGDEMSRYFWDALDAT